MRNRVQPYDTFRPSRLVPNIDGGKLVKLAKTAHNHEAYFTRERAMPVYHIIVHGFLTWDADNPKGYYRRGRGRFAAEPQLAAHWERSARFPTLLWSWDDQNLLCQTVQETSARRQWTVYAIASQPTHLHIVLAWHTLHPPERVQQTLKQMMSLALGSIHGRGRRWFSRNGVPQRIKNRTHLRHLLYDYLANQAVIFWRSNRPVL